MYHESRPRRHRRRFGIVVLLVVLVLACIAAAIFVFDKRAAAPKADSSPATTTSTSPTATPPSPAPFNKDLYSTTDPTSLWVIVNKQHPLNPINYVPSDLITLYGHQVSRRMSDDLQQMMSDSAKAGVNLTLVSSYRSYSYQLGLYNGYVAKDGQAKADTYSARPGYSEHQTGLAIDFGDKAGTCIVDSCYANTPEGQWLAANAYKYGFILRYTPGDQVITGYEAEPWHYRYVGQLLSREMHAENIATLEQFFNVPGGENYVSAAADTAPSQE